MKTLRMAVLAALAFLCAGQVHAQQTNLVQNLNIQLFGYSQGGSSSFKNTTITNVNFVQVNTRQIIQALANATMNSFSSTSKLVVVTPLGGGEISVQVRDGSQAPVDVSSFFVIETLSGSVTASASNTKNGQGTSVSYEIARFALQDDVGGTLNLHFDVNGVTTLNSTTQQVGSNVDANVSGSGDRNGNLMILQGSVDIFGHTLEAAGFNHGSS
jgi:hypothetical protein